MKIVINEFEKYEFQLPEEINARDFLILMQRLSYVQKLISRDPFLNEFEAVAEASSDATQANKENKFTPNQKKYYIKAKPSREEVVVLCKRYFSTVEERKQVLSEVIKIGYAAPHVTLNGWFHKYEITPQEVGLKRFPESNSGIASNESLKALRLENSQDNVQGGNTNA